MLLQIVWQWNIILHSIVMQIFGVNRVFMIVYIFYLMPQFVFKGRVVWFAVFVCSAYNVQNIWLVNIV